MLFPLFSFYSDRSAGVGEFPDIPRLAAWCAECGLSIIQLLPLNDVGTDFRPYDASSSFALEPMHLSLEQLQDVPAHAGPAAAQDLRERFPLKGRRFFDTGIKAAKLDALRKIFSARGRGPGAFERFKSAEASWLEPYSHYKILKRRFSGVSWEGWPEPYRERRADALARLAHESAEDLEFERWLQWQAAVQLEEARREANRHGVLIVGDLPFLVSRDSADVWAERTSFKLEKASGAPPDLYFADGQAWGMPPHNWQEQEKQGFSYLRRKVGYASRFYDAFRIDHFVGLFRVWTYDRGADGQAVKSTGAFDPREEELWESQGRRILDAMLDASDLLPCAEDLGMVPDCSAPVLRDYGIPGMEVQRWMRRWQTDAEWVMPAEYRPNSIAVISTHDMTPLELWWKTEAISADERAKFSRFLGFDPGPAASPEFVRACLRASLSAASIFSIQLFQDWLSLENPDTLEEDERINFPGLLYETNWRLLCRFSTEQLMGLSCTKMIRSLLSENNRLTKINRLK